MGGRFVDSLIETGLYEFVKATEGVIGVCLLVNLFVPLALLIELPMGDSSGNFPQPQAGQERNGNAAMRMYDVVPLTVATLCVIVAYLWDRAKRRKGK